MSVEKSPQQAAAMAIRSPERREWLLGASPREIQQFIHLNANNEYGRRDHELAIVALNVRIAEDAAKQSLRLETRIDNLLSIVDEQRRLATNLDGQTETLIGLTRWLKGLTVGLLVLTLVLCAFEARHFFEPNAHQTDQPANDPSPAR